MEDSREKVVGAQDSRLNDPLALRRLGFGAVMLCETCGYIMMARLESFRRGAGGIINFVCGQDHETPVPTDNINYARALEDLEVLLPPESTENLPAA